MLKKSEVEFVDIDINNNYLELINNIINLCFEEEKLSNINMYLNVILTNSQNIKNINKKYRNIDKETDVLSFPMFEKKEIEQIKNSRRNKANQIYEALGDIVISIPKIEEQAKEYGHSVERELAYMVVHGFYHILGYDHIIDTDKTEMRAKEENILNKSNIKRN